ncbi:phosphoribosylaminoimidazolesuccinocarboxamide synthase [Candidatus Pseudoscillospira sp. SGI.172]|uniref:phosphoribosylaminoimidazolesuccinocarboxamide synthase n=1 Tax=Candidatus Pseudoscillospira sp. SGI.172 TaxID=3420582 RepID=UPI002A76DE5A|nr:phosphoribosylaminoimidazolesuccinocarboxamide synthase [Pseudoflavonifractor sp.]MDY3020534.1 phosphoribosylaminoimidazolesuccinocarboxamide synthase [Oscillospiraceae bacterium]
MEKRELLYEGKAKKVYATDDANLIIVDYKDDATAGNGSKRGTIRGKGVVNNKVTNSLMQMLEKEGVPTHFVQQLSDRETVVKKVSIVPLEVIVRNVAAGSFTARLGVKEGTRFAQPTLEYSYKDDALGDPLINHSHALALGAATAEELATIDRYALKINEVLKNYLKGYNIDLIDFKLEFGRLPDGTIVLADEISPDTCRFWDAATGAHLDKDLFRRDLGGEVEAYQEVMKRLLGE